MRSLVSLSSRIGVSLLTWAALINIPDITDIPRVIILALVSVFSNADLVFKWFVVVKILVGASFFIVSLIILLQEQNMNGIYIALGGFMGFLSCLPLRSE
jgi:hypothetical protein